MAAMRRNAQFKPVKQLKPMKEPPKAANSNSKKETERERHLSSEAA